MWNDRYSAAGALSRVLLDPTGGLLTGGLALAGGVTSALGTLAGGSNQAHTRADAPASRDVSGQPGYREQRVGHRGRAAPGDRHEPEGGAGRLPRPSPRPRPAASTPDRAQL